MTDEGFDFRPPVDKRAPKTFEPPPWEREAFEELERKRARDVEEPPFSEVQPRDTERVGQQENLDPQGTGAGAESAQTPAVTEQGGVPESVVLEMMAGLAAEEPRSTATYSGVALGTGIFLVALGGVLVVWATAALVGARVTGWIGQMTGTGLGLFGLFFFGMGVWLLRRTLKQRGVL